MVFCKRADSAGEAGACRPKTGLTTPICRGSIHIRRLSWHLVSGKLLGALRRQRGFGLGGGLRGLFLDLISTRQAL